MHSKSLVPILEFIYFSDRASIAAGHDLIHPTPADLAKAAAEHSTDRSVQIGTTRQHGSQIIIAGTVDTDDIAFQHAVTPDIALPDTGTAVLPGGITQHLSHFGFAGTRGTGCQNSGANHSAKNH